MDVPVDVQTVAGGSVVVHPHGVVGPESAVQFRQVLVHAVRRLRPHRLILDLADVPGLDPINLGAVAAICAVATDQRVTVFVDNPTSAIAAQLHEAGVHHRHLRTTDRPA